MSITRVFKNTILDKHIKHIKIKKLLYSDGQH